MAPLAAMAPDDKAGYLLSSKAQIAHIARDAADLALRIGAQHAVVLASEKAGITMRARAGVFETAARQGGQALTIKVFDNGSTGTATTSALDCRSVRLAAEKALAIAHTVERDPDAAPADEAWLARSVPHLALFAPSGLAAQDLGRMALDIEAAGIAHGNRAVRIDGTGASSFDSSVAIAIGRDFDHATTASRHEIWCGAIAERDGLMVRDRWSSADRKVSRLLSPEHVAAKAIDRAQRKIGARAPQSGDCPVLFDATVAAGLVHAIVGALGGRAQFQRATFLGEGKGMSALADHVDLIEDPFEDYGLFSSVCDSEGVASRRRSIIVAGRIEDFFLSCRYARKLGLAPTGNADGVHNLRLTSREPAQPLHALLGRMGRGLWITELVGGALDPVSGAWSYAATGFWIENSEIAFPVHDFTIAGDLRHMLRGIAAIGSDVERNEAVRTGPVLIESMRVSAR